MTVRVSTAGLLSSLTGSIAIREQTAALSLDFRIWVAQLRQIRGARTGIQVCQQAKIARLGLEFGHPAVRIIDVAENNCLRGARLLASRENFAVAYLAVLLFRFDLHRIDPLDAVSTFFHDAAAAHGDIGIPQAIQAGRRPIGEEQEIEAPYLVGAVVGAIPRADAAVVDHFVEALGTMHGGSYRADQLTRRVFAVHARHDFVVHLRVGEAAFVIRIHTNPVHLTPVIHLLFADHRDIVFSLAGYHAGIAAD